MCTFSFGYFGSFHLYRTTPLSSHFISLLHPSFSLCPHSFPSSLYFRHNPFPLQSLISFPSLSCLPPLAETSAEWSYCCVSLRLLGAALQGPADWIRAFYSLWVDHREQMQIATSVESVQWLTQGNNAVWLRVKSQPVRYCRQCAHLSQWCWVWRRVRRTVAK